MSRYGAGGEVGGDDYDAAITTAQAFAADKENWAVKSMLSRGDTRPTPVRRKLLVKHLDKDQSSVSEGSCTPTTRLWLRMYQE